MIQISAIICTYNREQYLTKCLKSIKDQTLSKDLYEIVIIDNCSTDNTKNITHIFSNNNPTINVSYFYESNLGLSFARNTGWKQAKGKYVYYIDDDGIITPNSFKQFITVFNSSNDRVVACGGRIYVDYETSKPEWLPDYHEVFYGKYDRGEAVTETEYVPGGNSVWKKSFLEKHNGFCTQLGRTGNDGAGCEESLLNMQIQQQKLVLMYTPYAIMYHHAPKERLTKKFLYHRMIGQGKSSVTAILNMHGLLTKKQYLSLIWLNTKIAFKNAMYNLQRFYLDTNQIKTERLCKCFEALGKIHKYFAIIFNYKKWLYLQR